MQSVAKKNAPGKMWHCMFAEQDPRQNPIGWEGIYGLALIFWVYVYIYMVFTVCTPIQHIIVYLTLSSLMSLLVFCWFVFVVIYTIVCHPCSPFTRPKQANQHWNGWNNASKYEKVWVYRCREMLIYLCLNTSDNKPTNFIFAFWLDFFRLPAITQSNHRKSMMFQVGTDSVLLLALHVHISGFRLSQCLISSHFFTISHSSHKFINSIIVQLMIVIAQHKNGERKNIFIIFSTAQVNLFRFYPIMKNRYLLFFGRKKSVFFFQI